MLYKDIKLEKRNDNEPKFNKNNKTDRKILLVILILVGALLILLAGAVTLAVLYLNGYLG